MRNGVLKILPRHVVKRAVARRNSLRIQACNNVRASKDIAGKLGKRRQRFRHSEIGDFNLAWLDSENLASIFSQKR